MAIVGLTIIDFIIYFTVDSIALLIAWFLVMIIPKACICAWNHHHQHTMTFRSKPLNRLLEFSYALHTGVTTNLWLLHHVLGHHHNYLDQTQDQSRWKRDDGTQMGIFEYSFVVAATSYYRGFLVGRRYPKQYRTHLIFTLVTAAILIGLTIYQPLQAVLVFLLPMAVSLFITAWATYDHHAGLDETEDHFRASYNITSPTFNFLTGNLGYHTAHHFRQGAHWSELPELHETIKDRIPDELYIEPFWGLFWRYLTQRFGLQA